MLILNAGIGIKEVIGQAMWHQLQFSHKRKDVEN